MTTDIHGVLCEGCRGTEFMLVICFDGYYVKCLSPTSKAHGCLSQSNWPFLVSSSQFNLGSLVWPWKCNPPIFYQSMTLFFVLFVFIYQHTEIAPKFDLKSTLTFLETFSPQTRSPQAASFGALSGPRESPNVKKREGTPTSQKRKRFEAQKN